TRHGCRPTVVERAPQLRGGGYAVDFRGAAHLSVLAKMGILDRIRERQTHLSATTYVDADGRPVASMPAGIFAGDVEILRGDLGRILYEATRDGTEYLFGDSITGLHQDAGGVHVTFRQAAPGPPWWRPTCWPGSWPRPAATTAPRSPAMSTCCAATWPGARSRLAAARASSPRPPRRRSGSATGSSVCCPTCRPKGSSGTCPPG